MAATNPNVGRFNQKNLPYSQPGVGALNYGITVDNASRYVTKIRDAIGKGITTGGNERNWQRLQDWSSSPQAERVPEAQKAMYNQFLKTGKMPAGLNQQFVYNALDWTLRDSARHQQTKQSFLQKILSSPWTGIALGAVTGGLAGFANAGLAAVAGQASAGALAGTALGAVQGAATAAAIGAVGSEVIDAVTPNIPKGQSVGAIPGGGTIGGGGTSGGRTFDGTTGALLDGGLGPNATGGGGAAQRGVTRMGFGGETRAARRGGNARRAMAAPTLLGG